VENQANSQRKQGSLMKNFLKFIVALLLVAVFLTAGPFVFIWAVNTLAHASGSVALIGFNIPFTFKTWLAALVVGGLAVLPAARRS
jgi:hypothetical protein